MAKYFIKNISDDYGPVSNMLSRMSGLWKPEIGLSSQMMGLITGSDISSTPLIAYLTYSITSLIAYNLRNPTSFHSKKNQI